MRGAPAGGSSAATRLLSSMGFRPAVEGAAPAAVAGAGAAMRIPAARSRLNTSAPPKQNGTLREHHAATPLSRAFSQSYEKESAHVEASPNSAARTSSDAGVRTRPAPAAGSAGLG